jgi:hypothetical protein
MNTILQVLFSPARAFNELKQQEGKFPGIALIILLLLTAVQLILMVPVVEKIMTLTVSSMPMPENQLDMALAITHKLRYLIVIGQIFTVAIVIFVYALAIYIMAAIAKPALSYVKSLAVIVYSYFAVIIGGLVDAGLLYVKGLENIHHQYEIVLTGLNLFTSVEKVGGPLYTFLTMINPFQVWFVILLSIGLKTFSGMKYGKALIICIILWLFIVIYSVGSVFFSELVTKSQGIM